MDGAGEFQPKTLFAEIQANIEKLNACPRHLFLGAIPGIEGGVAAMLGKKIICKHCGGGMDLVNLNFYVRGYEASGKSGNDILPGWKSDEPKRRKFFGQPNE